MTIQQTLTEALRHPAIVLVESPEHAEDFYRRQCERLAAALASLADESGLLVIDTRTGQVCEVVPLAQYADDNIVGYAVMRPEGSQKP